MLKSARWLLPFLAAIHGIERTLEAETSNLDAHTDFVNLLSVTPRLVGFYHMYAQGGEYERIVEEQMDHLQSSGLGHKLAALRFTTVGENASAFAQKFASRYNQSVGKLVLISNKTSGSEAITLDRLHEFCSTDAEKDTLVFYTHTKGAFTANRENEKLRRALMTTVYGQHRDCVSLLSQGKSVCGMRFAPLPHFHFAGNMWWARCDYIKRLVRPSALEANPPRKSPFLVANSDAVMLSHAYLNGSLVLEEMPSPRNDHIKKCLKFDNINTIIPGGRWSLEHWVGSHPSLKAVDCMPPSPDGSFYFGFLHLDNYKYNNNTSNWTCLPALQHISPAEWIGFLLSRKSEPAKCMRLLAAPLDPIIHDAEFSKLYPYAPKPALLDGTTVSKWRAGFADPGVLGYKFTR